MAQPELHNPFEATFALLKALRDELNSLKNEVQELREAKVERFEKVEAALAAMQADKTNRVEELEARIRDDEISKNARLEAMSTEVEELRESKNMRFDKLEAALKAEVNDRFATTQALDKKIRMEVAQLRTISDKMAIEVNERKVKSDSAGARELQRHMDLRQDVEKLATLFSDNSMSKDPFAGLGYRGRTPKSLGTSLDTSLLPSLSGSQNLKSLATTGTSLDRSPVDAITQAVT